MSEIKKFLEFDKNSKSFQLGLKLNNSIFKNDHAPENVKKEFFKKELFGKEIIKKEISNESLPIQEIGNTQREKRFKCELCGTAFTQIGNLNRHIENKHEEKPKSYVKCHKNL